MTRRSILPVLAVVGWPIVGEEPSAARGKLGKSPDGIPALQTSGGLVHLKGDEPSLKVLLDARLAGSDLEVRGKRTAPNELTIDPIHTRAMYVHKGGKRLLVTYWCGVCYIRTYSPGTCWCCQDETELDLRDPATLDDK